MAGADSSARHPEPDDRVAAASTTARSDSTTAFHAELYADAGHSQVGRKGGGGGSGNGHGAPAKSTEVPTPPARPKQGPTPEEVAARRAFLGREQYKMIVNDAAYQAYDPTIFSNLNQLEHLYDKRIRNNKDAVAYAAQALKFTGDPYTGLILDDMSFPGNGAQVGINLKFPKDGSKRPAADVLATIDTIAPDSPAAKAKIAQGDQITHIDSISMRGRSASEVNSILDGVSGTKVDVTVMHEGTARTVTLTRAAIPAEALPAPDNKTGRLGMEYGMLSEDKKHLTEIPKDFKVNANDATLEAQPSDIIIARIVPNSAAEKAGLRRGDVIRTINGAKIAGESFETVSEKLRGNIGEAIDLGIVRDGKAQNIHAVRGEASVVQNITARDLGSGIQYINISEFKGGTGEDLRKAMEANPKAKAFIIDYRGNPGGLVDEAQNTLQLLMKSGTMYSTRERFNSAPSKPEFGFEKISVNDRSMVTEKGRDGEQPSVYTDARKFQYLLNGRPLVVLTNGLSASASEIVTGALKDNKLATIIGEKTYGKGIGQLQEDGSDQKNKYKLKVTNFRYFTPSGFCPGDAHYNRIGIEPDIKVEDNLSKGDPQLDAGVNFLKKALK